MASLWTFTLLCGLLTDTLVQATLSPPVLLNLGPEVIKEKLTQELQDHGATAILQQLPLLRAMKEKPASGIPLLGSLVDTVLSKIIWLKVTSANILQMQVQASAANQELMVNIPLDMVAGFNTPLVKTIVKLQMQTEIQAVIRVETSKEGPTRHILSNCSTSPGSLRLTLLYKLSILVNILADKVIELLAPALPQLVKNELCPVIELAFNDMYADLLKMVKVPISLSPDRLEFDLLSPAIKDNAIQFNLVAKLLDSKGTVNKYFNNSVASLTIPTLGSTPFSLIVRQDVVNAVVAALVPPEEIIILLDYVLPELARELKARIRVINEKAADQLGPTQIVKIRTQETPKLLLSQDSATVAQLIVLEVFATNEALHPFFTLGIEASSEAQFYTKGDLLMLNFNNLRCNRIQLMNWAIGWFKPEPLTNIITEILLSTLLPNQNGKLRPGVPVSIVKDLGFEAASCSLIKNALVVTPASSQMLDSPLSQ
ncbi:BPI fold-containing family B member 1 [Otolemur garnettii]|uniref:BPI fold-containing family B member 1 n=1 Tax=Otolemur garnettii TaxID=30611 RepID=UPI0002740379|nr:BPI fold-containing family B member 1 [Otolemur garnettii]